MSDAYTFEYNGVSIEYFRSTVRTELEASRIRRRLIAIYGTPNEPMPRDEYDNIDEYASAMARSKANAPWWTHSNAPDNDIQTAFELFLEQDSQLYDSYRAAYVAILMPKKTA